jgi:hypothetical protein
MMDLTQYIVAAPEMTLLGLICIVLVADLFIEQERRIITFWMALASLGATLCILLATSPDGRTEVFSGSYVSDGLSQVLKISVTGFVAVAFMYARDYLRANDLHKGEFYTLGLFGLLGMMIMISANSLLTMYLGLETLALSQYALVAFDRNNENSAESAMKYFVLGAIASGALLYGISWVYGVTGSIQFNEIAAALIDDPAMNSLPLWFGIAFIVVGIAFKFGAVPFHMWLPDVHFVRGLCPEDCRIRADHPYPRRRAGRPARRLERHDHGDRGVIAAARQYRCHRADQHQAYARVFDDRARRLHPARHLYRHRGGLRGGNVLHADLRCGGRRCIRHGDSP